MNHTADQWRKNNDSGEQKRRGFLRRLMSHPFLVLGGFVLILLAGFVFYPYTNAPLTLVSDLKTGPKVFRAKIPEEIKIAQNLFRGKIPAVDQPLKPPPKIESTPPVEKKAVLSEPIMAPPEPIEPLPEAASSQPVESPIIHETTPPVAKAELSQPIDAPFEKSKVRQETAPHLPAEPKTKIETNLSAEEQPVYSQPTVVPSGQEVLPEKADLRQTEVRPQPVKKDVIEKTEERIIHREKWLLSQESSHYTIQLMGARKKALLFNFVERNQLLELNEIAFYQTTFKDKQWFQLLYGVYTTKKDAQSAADNLPPKIRKSSPWIRRMSAVQKAIRIKAAQY
jgi:septal ring-binding cell division protein DamX